MSICVIVPSRGRPQSAAALIDAFESTRTLPGTTLLFAIDDDDPALPRYLSTCEGHNVQVIVGPRLRMGPTLNREAMRAAPHYDVIGFMGDDHRPRTDRWDDWMLRTLQPIPGVAYGDDRVHGPGLPTAVFVHSQLIQRLGYIGPPRLIHLYLDNFWLELGRATHLTYLPHVVIEHMHPLVGKADWDEGYQEVNSGETQQHDRQEFERYMAQDWPLERQRLIT